MAVFQTVFELPNRILQGLNTREYIRFGGVIRDAKTKHIVAMLREVGPGMAEVSTLFTQFGSVASLCNLGVSVLNLGVSIVGFSLILKRLKEIEKCLKKDLDIIQESLNHLHQKFDISVCANFSAALSLANDATTMFHPENRRTMAVQAINRFLEAQHIYINYVDISLKENLNLTEKYLLLLSLTYIARARCYLELEEITNAVICLQEGSKLIRIRFEQYVKSLLISQPISLYRDSPIELHKKVSLIYQWLEPQLNNSLNDIYIGNTGLVKNINKTETQHKIETGIPRLLPKAIPMFAASLIPVFGEYIAAKIGEKSDIVSDIVDIVRKDNSAISLWQLENIEQIIETYNRFESYLLEVQIIQQQGMSFQNWLQFDSGIQGQLNEGETIYILPLQPLNGVAESTSIHPAFTQSLIKYCIRKQIF